jgi:hypothetical protein
MTYSDRAVVRALVQRCEADAAALIAGAQVLTDALNVGNNALLRIYAARFAAVAALDGEAGIEMLLIELGQRSARTPKGERA